jgi:hypothetical protein
VHATVTFAGRDEITGRLLTPCVKTIETTTP